MKSILKYCLFTFYLSLSGSLFAQSFISENKLWRYDFKIYSEPCCGHVNGAYKFQGDSIINDTIYAKLYESTDEFLVNWKLYGLWRETDDNKIFKRGKHYPLYLPEELSYDFSLVKNDTFITQDITFKVDSVLTLNWGGKLRKHWYLNPVSANKIYSTVWIEGVGQLNYFLLNINGNVGAQPYLLCFEENGQQVYQNPEYNTCFYTSLNDISFPDKGFKVYPNPVSGELFIQPSSNTEEAFTLEMYSVKGELLRTECVEAGSNLHRIDTSLLRNGIYILRLISDSGKYDEEVIVKE